MNRVTLSSLTICAVLFSGCNGEGNFTSNNEETGGSDSSTTNGKFNVIAKPTSGVDCSDAKIVMEINDTVISGTGVIVNTNASFNLSGLRFTNGKITGSYTFSGVDTNQQFATYSGEINANQLIGTWQDIYGCLGTWSGTKQ